MRRTHIIFLMVFTFAFLAWAGYTVYANERKDDTNAAKQLEFIRKNLTNLTEMKSSDAKQYYEEALKDLHALIEKYPGTEQELEANFYAGVIHNEMHNYNEAIKYFDSILSQEMLHRNFKARTLYFKIMALLKKGDVVKVKETIAELKLVEPRAADSFGKELSGIVSVGYEAPSFTGMDLKGNTIDLAKYKGDIVVIDFWATWCDPCMQEFPKFKKVYNKFKTRGIKFIGVSLDDDIRDLNGFVEQEGIEWPQIFDGKRWKGTVPGLYRVLAIPMIFVLDRESRIRYIGSSTENVSQVLTTLLSESKELPLFR
ncbi:MAG: redoxin domain-containing protein [Candidatus Loosdrechtia sp.]|uniref:redoxin domain-containing protein n=1 Tax=Candidatus Loosdrechtia sp. TaxID=3101272 RepID=UPI003A706D26|nr:MAG: redoxin domain-containing protein [Candidatus Jettenia sp. AMX2]